MFPFWPVLYSAEENWEEGHPLKNFMLMKQLSASMLGRRKFRPERKLG